MRLSFMANSVSVALALALALGGCRQSEPATALVEAASTDTGEVFYLSPEEEARLTRQAEAGDGEAAFRLAQFWGMSGGRSGIAGTLENSVQERRWLEAAAAAGHGVAKFNLALKVALESREKGCPMLEAEVTAATGTPNELNARAWFERLCVAENLR